jgi:hypothetical protein
VLVCRECSDFKTGSSEFKMCKLHDLFVNLLRKIKTVVA